MILGIYKPYASTTGFEGSYWRVSTVNLELGDINNLIATCTIRCYKDYNFANTNPQGFIRSLVASTADFETNQTSSVFHTFFEGSANPIEVQNSYYNFFKETHEFFVDAILIDTDKPETLQYLGENPQIIIPE